MTFLPFNRLFSDIVSTMSDLFSIGTPIILLIWFYISRRQVLSQFYFKEIGSEYAGFIKPLLQNEKEATPENRHYAGVIFDFHTVNSSGYFRGEFEYKETTLAPIPYNARFNSAPNLEIHGEGLHTFWGKIDFELFLPKRRQPFNLKDNRKYNGSLYVVDRLDLNIATHQVIDFLVAEYKFVHYREMEVIDLNLHKHVKKEILLPATITLYKKTGADFEPYSSIKRVVFGDPFK